MRSLKISLSLFMIVVVTLCSYAPVYAVSEIDISVAETVIAACK